MSHNLPTIPVASSPLDELFRAAAKAAGNAYAPHSRFHVGAAVRSTSGRIFVGCNVENVAYPLGTCAEAAAIAAARAAEGKALRIEEIAIYGEQGQEWSKRQVPCAPCGGCRQRIYQFGKDIRVHFMAETGEMLDVSAAELLPHAFGFEPGWEP